MLVPHINAHTLLQLSYVTDCDWLSITILLIVIDELLLAWTQGVYEARLCIIGFKLNMW